MADARERPADTTDPSAAQTAKYGGRVPVVLAFVGVWMALGLSLNLDVNEYLLLGVPLTVGFQLLVRRPLLALWVRDAPRPRLNLKFLLVSAAFAALPGYELFRAVEQNRGWVIIGWYSCAVFGAVGIGYAVQSATRRVSRSIAPALAITLFVWLFLVVMGVRTHGWGVLSGSALWTAVRWTLLYFPVCFVIEEVTFRGALDGYYYRPEDRKGIGTAAQLSFLWGIWHLGVFPWPDALITAAIQLGVWHMLVGVPLTMSWRIGGNLLVPAAAHAAIDGVRNAMMNP